MAKTKTTRRARRHAPKPSLARGLAQVALGAIECLEWLAAHPALTDRALELLRARKQNELDKRVAEHAPPGTVVEPVGPTQGPFDWLQLRDELDQRRKPS